MLFWLIIILSTVIVLVLLLQPWTASGSATDETGEDRLRISIYQQNLHELGREFERGQLTREQFENVRNELELSLLAEIEREKTLKKNERTILRHGNWRSAILPVAVSVCVAVPLYLLIGNPQMNRLEEFSDLARQSDGSQALPLEDYIPQMQKHLERNPRDENGWLLLADIYSAQQQHAAAADALEKLHQMAGDNTEVMLRYANALVMANDGKFGGRPAELAQRVLAVEPQNYTALLFAGMAADEAGKYAESLQYYRRLLPGLRGNAEVERTVNTLIARNEQLLRDAGIDPGVTESDVPATAPDVAVSLRVTVAVADEFAGKYAPDDTVFIYAQAIDGPPMPLAVARHKASELPLEVTLDDSMAMMPTMKLSGFAKVRLQGRISKSGNAQPEPGDLIGVLEPVDVPAAGILNITIDSILP